MAENNGISQDKKQWFKNCDMVMDSLNQVKFSVELIMSDTALDSKTKLENITFAINSLAPTIADRLWYYPSPQSQ